MKENKVLVYAEDVNYWQTSRTSPDEWIAKTKRIIQDLGGKVVAEGFGANYEGKAAFMVGFEIKEEAFKIVWPVLPSWKENERASRIQAATCLYHYTKGVCLYAVVVGVKTAFFSHLMLPDGRVASECTNPEIAQAFPKLLR
jgi:hypothetical protein